MTCQLPFSVNAFRLVQNQACDTHRQSKESPLHNKVTSRLRQHSLQIAGVTDWYFFRASAGPSISSSTQPASLQSRMSMRHQFP